MPVVDVIDGADHRRIISFAQMIDIQRVADLPDAALHIQARSAVRIGLISDCLPDLIRNAFDKP